MLFGDKRKLKEENKILQDKVEELNRKYKPPIGRCIHCYFDLLEGYQFCPKCGAPVKEEPIQNRDNTQNINNSNQMFEYKKYEEGIQIEKYIGFNEEKIIIPGTIEGEHVVSIKTCLFIECDWIKEVYIEDNIRYIGNQAFFACRNLERIRLPETLKGIGESVFASCAKIEVINIPESVERVGNAAFSSCIQLKMVNIPKRWKSIPNNAFERCISLEHIYIPDGMITICPKAFAGCKKLSELEFPASVLGISEGAFEGCMNLHKVVIQNNVSYISMLAFRNQLEGNPPFLHIQCDAGSVAQEFARKNRITYSKRRDNSSPKKIIKREDDVVHLSIEVLDCEKVVSGEKFVEDVVGVSKLTALEVENYLLPVDFHGNVSIRIMKYLTQEEYRNQVHLLKVKGYRLMGTLVTGEDAYLYEKGYTVNA